MTFRLGLCFISRTKTRIYTSGSNPIQLSYWALLSPPRCKRAHSKDTLPGEGSLNFAGRHSNINLCPT